MIFHGTYGSPEGNWFPWLASEMLDRDYEVFIPKLPTPEDQHVDNWLKIAKRLKPDEQTILIGHSSGASFLAHLLASLKTPVKASILVSPFTGEIGIPEYDALNKSFFTKGLDFSAASANKGESIIIGGDDDPYVPINQMQSLSQALEAPLFSIKNGGHLNSESGYDEFPEILRFIK